VLEPFHVWYTKLAPIALTCGLRISDNPTSDNLTPQEITNEDFPDMGRDGADLSGAGSTVVAEISQDDCVTQKS